MSIAHITATNIQCVATSGAVQTVLTAYPGESGIRWRSTSTSLELLPASYHRPTGPDPTAPPPSTSRTASLPPSTRSPSSSSATPTAIQAPDESRQPPTGVVVGSVIGGLAGLAILAVIALCFFRSRRAREPVEEERPRPNISQPTRVFLRQNSRGELAYLPDLTSPSTGPSPPSKYGPYIGPPVETFLRPGRKETSSPRSEDRSSQVTAFTFGSVTALDESEDNVRPESAVSEASRGSDVSGGARGLRPLMLSSLNPSSGIPHGQPLPTIQEGESPRQPGTRRLRVVPEEGKAFQVE